MKKIITAAAAGVLTLSLTACNTPGERALGGATLGGLAGAAFGGLATGHTGGALAGAAVGGAGGAIVGAATTPEPTFVAESAPSVPGRPPVVPSQARPTSGGGWVNPGSQGRVNPGSQGRVNPGSQGRVNQGSRGWSPKDCKYGTIVSAGSVVCSP